MHSNRSPVSLQELTRAMHLNTAQHKHLKDILANLLHRQVLTVSRKGLYSLRQDNKTLEGVIEMHPRGFGFVVIDNPPAELRKAGARNDPFISPANLGTANHGDRVLVAIISRRRHRAEAKVLQIIERAATRLAGIFTAGRDTGLVTPEDDRITFKVIVQRQDCGGARSGNAVLVDIIDFRTGQRNPTGRIAKVLGDPEDINVQALLVASKFGLPYEFEPGTIKDSEKLAMAPPADQTARENLLGVAHVTIDGEKARDFDDAVAVVKTDRGYRLYVSIADVGHYVRPGTPIDREAYRRGTSVYFPTMVLPMLPEALSNDLCSLLPDTERLTFTAVLDFDRQGHRLAKRFFKSVIKSRYRLTYTQVKHMVVDRDRQLRRQYRPITTQLDWMGELAAELERCRLERGSIGFTLPEAELQVDEEDRVTAVLRTERNLAHKIIEEFMLAANEAVAETFAENRCPALYRIHEPPDPLKVAEFTKFAATLGMALPRGSGSPQWFGRVLAQVAGTPKEYIVNNLLLRTMQRARYSPENVGHFGLAASHYTHFTSPIRRYPDLMVHRALAAIIAGKVGQSEAAAGPEAQLVTAGDFLSGREKTATEAEWEMVDRLKVRFMADKVGETFDGIVSGATDFGLFVELLQWFVGGAIGMADLDDDHYFYDEKHHRLVGRYTGKVYQIGDLVRVTVKSIEIQQRRVNFVIAPQRAEKQ
jgi:ribonuclease R